MKAFKYSPNQVRYALTGLLLGSLGFSLSMNPEQSQNISRNELNWGTYSLSSAAIDAKAEEENRRKDEENERRKKAAKKKPAAKTQEANAEAEKKVKDAREAAEKAIAPTKPLTKAEVEEMVAQAISEALKVQQAASTGNGQTPTTPAAAPATTSGETATGRGAPAVTTAAGSTGSAPGIKQDFILGIPSSNQQCHVEISSTTDGKSLAKVTKLTDASTCAKVGDHVINTPASNLAGIAEGLIAKLSEGEGNAGNSPKETAKQSIADKIKSLKEEYKQRAKAECSQKEMEYQEKLSCAQDLAVELSDTIASNPLLNETKEAKRLMNEFVKFHVVPRISEGMMAQTITYDQFGRPIENTDNIEKMNQANQAALSLLENLNPEVTDSSLVGQLARTRTLGYNTQIGYARNMYLEAQEDKRDPTRFQIGILKENIAKMNLYPSTLNWMLAKDTMDWNNALSSGDKSEFRGVVQGVLTNSVAGVIGQLPSASLYGQVDSMKQDLAAQALLKVSLDGSLSMTASTNPSAIPGSTPATPGAITSGLPAALASARLAGQGNRTNGLDLTNVTPTSQRPAASPSVGQPATTTPAPATQPPAAQPRGRVSRTGSN